MTRVVHAGVSRQAAEESAFERAAAAARTLPGSVLYLEPEGISGSGVADRWEEFGDPIQLRVQVFNDLVTEVHEKQYFETSVRTLSGEERQRLVDVAVDSLDESHPIASRRDLASAETYAQSDEILSLLEFGRLADPAELLADDRLDGVDDRVRDSLYALSRAFDEARDRYAAAVGTRQSARSERYQTVVDDRAALASVLDQTDAVVLGGFPFFSPLEADLVEAIADIVGEVHAVLPLAGAADPGFPDDATSGSGRRLSGVDRGAERAWRDYRDMGFDVERVPCDEDSGSSIVRQLYRHTDEDPPDSRSFAAAGIERYAYPTVAHEVRGTAREVRNRLREGVAPDAVGVVTTSPGTYTQEVFETFSQFGIPVEATREFDLTSTELGDALGCALRLGAGDGTVRDVVRLVDNPLVAPSWPGEPVESVELVRAGDALQTTDVDALVDLLDRQDDGPAGEPIEWLVDVCGRLHDVDAASAVQDVESVLSVLGIAADTTDDRDEWELLPDVRDRGWEGDRERAALRQLRRIVDSYVDTAPVFGSICLGERLLNAIEGATVEATLGTADGVELLAPGAAAHRTFEHVFVLGLTQNDFPTNPFRLAFTRSLNEAHPDFAQSDAVLQARYGIGLQLARAAEVVLSRPKWTPDGDETVAADFLAELDRVAADGALREQAYEEFARPPASREDVQRRVATTFASLQRQERRGTETETATEIADEVARSGVLDGAAGVPAERLRAGVACATARRAPQTTEYDGHVSAETFQQYEAATAALSPSRVDTYVTCGFKFYVQKVLGFEEDREHSLEPDSREAGSFVHDVVARFFLSLQDAPGEPVEIDDPTAYHDAMYEAAMIELDRSGLDEYDTTFSDGWLTKLLAGLDPADRENAYDGPEGYRGLLVRLLDSVADETEKNTTRPAFFEASVGVNYGDGPKTVLSTDPVDLVPESGFRFRGKVDRVDVVPDTDPREFTAVDYKTGSAPSIADVRGGISFQLPLYLRLLEAALDGERDWLPIGATYYDLSVPEKARIKKSPLASSLHTAHYRSHAEAPLRHSKTDSLFDQHGHPALNEEFDDGGEPGADDGRLFTQFVGETLDERLREVTAALDDGVFHPTLLGETKANCDYCDYAHVCDVRHHQREDRLVDNGLDEVYVPQAAASAEVLEADE